YRRARSDWPPARRRLVRDHTRPFPGAADFSRRMERPQAQGRQGDVSMSKTIYVINPNSSTTVTAGIDEAVAPLRFADGPSIECLTLEEGPKGIQSQRDVEDVVAPMLKRAAELEESASAFVVACFSDPGMFALREQSRHPV